MQQTPPGIPRWVKVSAFGVLVAVLLIAALLVLGGGGHGPGRHSSDDGPRPSSIGEGAHTPPEGAH